MRLSELPSGLAALILSSQLASAFYLPGISPQDYSRGDLVQLNVNRLTPSTSQRDEQVKSVFSFDYYHHPFHFCQPQGGVEYASESLGSILFGDRIQSSPFLLHMLQNETCKAVCNEQTFEPRDAKFVNRRIFQDYKLSMLIDGLPAGQRFITKEPGTGVYLPGFPLGRVENNGPTLNTHYDFMINYHEFRKNQYRVVGVEVFPQSLGDAKRTGTGNDFTADCGSGNVAKKLSESANTKVTWTYSVYWRPSRTSFATRWDKFLNVYNPSIHWLSLITFAVIFMFLVSMVSMILSRTLKKDIARYNRLDSVALDDLRSTGLQDDVQEDSGWKLVHGDVFRPPRQSLILSVLVGNGAQLFMMTGFTIAFAVVGFLSPSNRGSLTTVMILLYTFFGFIGGYTSSRVYKSFGGTKWKQLFTYTPLAIPVVVFGTFFLLDLFVWARRSSGAVPFTTMLVIVGIWFLISVPLSVAGSWIGFRQHMDDPPTRTNQIPRQIPPSTGYMRLVPSLLAGGVLPFASIFIEVWFIMSSLWSNRIYYMFGFLFLSFGLLIVTSAAVTILMIYFLLCAENYHWQWRAFASSGASAGYVFTFCLLNWVRMLSFSSFTGGLLYLGYSALISFLWFVMSGKYFTPCLMRRNQRLMFLTGTIGFCACWVFVHRIYGSLKVD